MARPLPNDPPWLKAAFSKLGLSEIVGPKHEKQVLEMYAACGHPQIKDDETAWCAAFVGWCLRQANLPNTGSLMARSYVRYGTPQPHSKIPRGAICVWPRGKPPSGHVNFCLDDDGETLTLIGGNQGNGKGGGVTITRESKDKLIEAVMPKRATAPKPKPPPDVEPTEPKPPKPVVQSSEIWSQLLTIITTVASVVTDIRFLALIVILFCAYQIWKRYERGDLKLWGIFK